MKRLILLSIILFAQKSTADELPTIGDLLPESGSIVEIMKTTVPERCDSLVTEWRLAMAQNYEWALEYMKRNSNLKPGEILPYSDKFGITEQEYYEMVECISTPSFEKIAEDEFTIVKEGSIYIIDSTLYVRDLINLRIDEENMILEGYFGTISSCDTVISRDAPIGKWTGYSWREEEGDEQNGRLVAFTLGYFDNTLKGMITFKLRIIEDGVPTAACDWKVFYESGVQ